MTRQPCCTRHIFRRFRQCPARLRGVWANPITIGINTLQMSRLCAGKIIQILIIRKHDIRPHPRLHRPAAGASETEFPLIRVLPCLVEFIPCHTCLRQNEELPIPSVVQSTPRLIEHSGSVLPCLIAEHPAHGFRLQTRQVRTSHEQRH